MPHSRTTDTVTAETHPGEPVVERSGSGYVVRVESRGETVLLSKGVSLDTVLPWLKRIGYGVVRLG